MATSTKYIGNCHCAAFTLEVELPCPLTSAAACLCSLCAKHGSLWVFPSADNSFRLLRGSIDALKVYQTAVMAISFCPSCGVGLTSQHTSGPLTKNVAINARILRDINPFLLKVEMNDTVEEGASVPPAVSESQSFMKKEEADEDLVTYKGSCHCGLVSLAMTILPLSHVEVKEDNCSICVRLTSTLGYAKTGFVGIYPHQSQVHISGGGANNEKEYQFGLKFMGHPFCKVCGVRTHMNVYGPPKAVFDSWPEARRSAVKKNFEILPVNVRVLEGVKLESIEVKRLDEGTAGYDPDKIQIPVA